MGNFCDVTVCTNVWRCLRVNWAAWVDRGRFAMSHSVCARRFGRWSLRMLDMERRDNRKRVFEEFKHALKNGRI